VCRALAEEQLLAHAAFLLYKIAKIKIRRPLITEDVTV